MSHDVLDAALETLLGAEAAFAAHARYHVCRELISEVLLYEDKPLPAGLVSRLREVAQIRSHDDNPVSRRLHYWVKFSDEMRLALATANQQLIDARKKIIELEGKKNV